MSYYAKTFQSQGPLGDSHWGATLFQAGKPRFSGGRLSTRDRALLSAYASSKEAALLQLRAALSIASAAVECEVVDLRKKTIAVKPPAINVYIDQDDIDFFEEEDALEDELDEDEDEDDGDDN